MSNFNLTEEAVLGKLSVHQGQITAKSKTLTSESAANHKADKSRTSGTIVKLTSEARAKIVNAINEATAIFKANCLPWEDRGSWLLPVVRLSYVQKEMDRIRNNFMDALQELLDNYDSLQADYYRALPGVLSQEVPFPTKQQLADAFGLDFYITALPNTADVRLNHISTKAVDELRESMQADMDKRLGNTRQAIVDRLTDNVKTLHTQTADKESRLFKSLVTNIEEDCDVLPSLNLTKDPEIDRLIKRVRTELSSLDIDSLKQNAKLRAQTHKLSGSILAELENYGKAPKAPVVAAPVSAKIVVEKLVDAPVPMPVASIDFSFGDYGK